MSLFNELTPAQLERLSLLSEELGESIQIIGKILRHGYESYNPFDDSKTSNRQLLEKELGDVQHALHLLTTSGDLNKYSIQEHQGDKSKSVGKWLHHQN